MHKGFRRKIGDFPSPWDRNNSCDPYTVKKRERILADSFVGKIVECIL